MEPISGNTTAAGEAAILIGIGVRAREGSSFSTVVGFIGVSLPQVIDDGFGPLPGVVHGDKGSVLRVEGSGRSGLATEVEIKASWARDRAAMPSNCVYIGYKVTMNDVKISVVHVYHD